MVRARRRSLLTIVGLMMFLGGGSPHAQVVGTADSFAIVGGQAVNANGTGSIVTGNVGISPAAGTNITGFPGFPPNQTGASTLPPFTVRGNDASAISAEAASDALFNSAVMAPLGGVAITANLSTGGPTANGHYTPGKYSLAVGTAIIPTSITLDGPGTYIFSLNTQLTTSVGSSILLNGVNPCSVWWRVPTQATLNGASFAGTVVSDALIAVGVGATVSGRLLTTANGSVTLAGTDVVGGCSGAAAQPPPPASTATDLFIIKSHTGPFVVGQNATYTIQTLNSGTTASNGLITVTDTLPAGLTFVSATGVNSWTCSASGQVVTCTTPAAVGNGSLGNNITITVTPTAAAVPTVTNTAVVSGGGDSNPANNSTADVTLVVLSVPTLPEWAMIVLLLLLATAGTVALRRQSAWRRG
jgi:uncharacterized repeat protein (TIGR01451 family)